MPDEFTYDVFLWLGSVLTIDTRGGEGIGIEPAVQGRCGQWVNRAPGSRRDLSYAGLDRSPLPGGDVDLCLNPVSQAVDSKARCA